MESTFHQEDRVLDLVGETEATGVSEDEEGAPIEESKSDHDPNPNSDRINGAPNTRGWIADILPLSSAITPRLLANGDWELIERFCTWKSHAVLVGEGSANAKCTIGLEGGLGADLGKPSMIRDAPSRLSCTENRVKQSMDGGIGPTTREQVSACE